MFDPTYQSQKMIESLNGTGTFLKKSGEERGSDQKNKNLIIIRSQFVPQFSQGNAYVVFNSFWT